MRHLIFVILSVVMLFASLAQASDVLILQSRRDRAYEEVLQGFRNGHNISYRLIVLTDYSEVDVLRIVREDRPAVILAIGDAALNEARKVQKTPVVALMTLGIHDTKGASANLTGVEMFAPPEKYIALFQGMKAKRIGVIYNADRSGWYLRLAQKRAQDAGITLVTREVKAPRETIQQLASLAGKVDALWMLPDSTAVTRESTEAYFLFGQQHSVPVVSFAEGYLGLGALAVLEIDRAGLGRQSAEMVTAVLNDGNVRSVAPRFPKVTKKKCNQAVGKRLGILLTTSD